METPIHPDKQAIDNGYPIEQLTRLIEQSQYQYNQQVREHGPGKNWLEDESRWHIWKACDELFQARNHAHSGNYETALHNFSDSLNHMLFAMEICQQMMNNNSRKESNQ